jgi:hypothetical protein
MKPMKIFTSALIFLTFLTPGLFAQDSVSIPDTLSGWHNSWEIGINGSQASYSNWSQGGVNNIAATGSSVYTAIYREGRFSYGFLANFRYGKTKIEDEGTRKIDDRLLIVNKFLYDLGHEGSEFKAFGKVRVRTQFDEGFNYGSGEDEEDELISKFLAPAYFTEDIGVAYIPSEHFTFEAGLGLQQTYISDEALSEIYGLDAGDQFRSEAGLTLASDLNAPIAENLSFSTSINTFTSFNKSLSSTDVIISNAFVGKINSFMNATLNLDFIYDDDFSDEIQVAQVLSLGVSFTLR